MTNRSMRYAELHCHTNFSFLDGASHPEALVEQAVRLDYSALAVTDHHGFYGLVKFWQAAGQRDCRRCMAWRSACSGPPVGVISRQSSVVGDPWMEQAGGHGSTRPTDSGTDNRSTIPNDRGEGAGNACTVPNRLPRHPPITSYCWLHHRRDTRRSAVWFRRHSSAARRTLLDTRGRIWQQRPDKGSWSR